MRIADGARLLSVVLIWLSFSPSLLESQTANLTTMSPTAWAIAGHKRSETDIPRSVLGNLPLQFEENKGQAEGSIRFLARGLGYTLLLNPDGLELNLRQKGNRPTRHLSMHLLGTQASNLLGRDLTATQTNYYLGRDPRNWHLGVRSYSSVVYEGVSIKGSTSFITAVAASWSTTSLSHPVPIQRKYVCVLMDLSLY